MTEYHDQECLRYFAEIMEICKSGSQYERVFHLVVYRIARLYKCQSVAIIMIDPKTEYLAVANSYGLSLTFCNEFRKRLATGAIGELLWTGKPILIPDSRLQAQRAAEIQLEHAFGSCLCLQIAVDHRTLGYLHAESAEKHAFSEKDVLLMQTFADIAGLAFFKSRLYEENLRLDPDDHQTGLEKYAPFLERVRSVVHRAETSGDLFNLILLDVDNFKNILKNYGREASDDLLKRLALIVREGCGNIHAAARYGFDEFILLIEHAAQDRAIEYARMLRKQVEETPFTKYNLQSSISIGISSFPQNAATLDDLVVTAKNALFEAQRAGRNKICYYPKEWYAEGCTIVE